MRAVAGHRQVYSVPLAIFIDDVSGNQSKQWNKHFSCYMSNATLPRSKLDSEFHVRFVATSPHATPLEIMQGVRASIELVPFLLLQACLLKITLEKPFQILSRPTIARLRKKFCYARTPF